MRDKGKERVRKGWAKQSLFFGRFMEGWGEIPSGSRVRGRGRA